MAVFRTLAELYKCKNSIILIIIQVAKFLNGDWFERAVFISNTEILPCKKLQFPNMAIVTIDTKKKTTRWRTFLLFSVCTKVGISTRLSVLFISHLAYFIIRVYLRF